MKGPEGGPRPSSFSGASLNTGRSFGATATLERSPSFSFKSTITKAETIGVGKVSSPADFLRMPSFRPTVPAFREESSAKNLGSSLIRETKPFPIPEQTPKSSRKLIIHAEKSSDNLEKTFIPKVKTIAFESKNNSPISFTMPESRVTSSRAVLPYETFQKRVVFKNAQEKTPDQPNKLVMLKEDAHPKDTIKSLEQRVIKLRRNVIPDKEDVEESTGHFDAVKPLPEVLPLRTNILSEVKPQTRLAGYPKADAKPQQDSRLQPQNKMVPESFSAAKVKSIQEVQRKKKQQEGVIIKKDVDSQDRKIDIFVKDMRAVSAFRKEGMKAADNVMGRVVERPITGADLLSKFEVTGAMISRLAVKNKTKDGSLLPRLHFIAAKSIYTSKEQVAEVLKKATDELPPVDEGTTGETVRRKDVDLVLNGVERVFKPAA